MVQRDTISTYDRDPSRRAAEGQMSPCTRCAAVFVSVAVLLPAADLSTYRGLQLGANVAEAAQYAMEDIAAVRVVHGRPALIQELEWRPGYEVRHDTKNPDPVREHVLRFLNGRLFQIVSNYDSQKVEGMTAADLIDGISRTYGISSAPGGQIPYQSNFGSAAVVIARWEDAEHCADLVRSPDGVTYALLVTWKQLDSAARAAIAEARRLDEIEAPERAIEQRKREESEQQLMLEKSRSTNKPNFRP
jgi:hypothetical protein